ncbi:kinesin KIFC3 isoform X4 isoform A [Micractinium conductrix]|uniref:Kinesin KIFC3 isoform X4 isoform A n=1 Tax=Micractinium conductrix TaxID=554055 RepID=A0A2P6VC83_9CHLO|nr:kinesin KIFC3 isoform X4 isoform A [Micractinium conductrix]|eukprot:PSC71702.1 kinesin KIFC3 isoform X4 isoform A [Micractinium conductrix]
MASQRPSLSELLEGVPRGAGIGTSTLLAADEELLVPRLVARIAELEERLYTGEAGGDAGEAGSLLDRFGGLLKKAQQGLETSIAYVVGDTDTQQAQLSAVTKEATAKALLITIKKLQALKADKSRLEEASASLALELESARSALAGAQAAAAAAAQAEAAARAAAADGVAAAAHAAAAAAADQAALAETGRALEAARAEAAVAAAGDVAAQAAANALAAQVEGLQQQLGAAQNAAAELQRQLDASRGECEALQARLVAAAAEHEGAAAEAEALRSARAALSQELNETRLRLERTQGTAEDFQRRFLQERAERRKVHETLQVLRGNIRVCCRVRPPASSSSKDGTAGISFPYHGSLCVHATERRQQEFEFDSVFSGQASQEEVFDEVWPLIRSCADGYNVCILAYGQTGSGKTHTMMGPRADPGLSVRALRALFEITSAEAADGQRRSITVSMLEVYNEALRDLLTAAEASGKLDVSAMGAGQLAAGQERVPGLTWRSVTCVEDVLSVLAEGSKNRATAATSLNAHSSRSHALLSVRLTDSAGQASVLHLIDLAGSERIARSEVAGQQLKEAQAINKSLSALGDVIASLQAKNGHVPYRNSKLTQVLQDSLCGSSKVLLVCCVSPEVGDSPETLSSLNFASRAAQVELGQISRAGEGTPASVRRASAAAASQSPLTPGARKAAGMPASGGRPQRSALRDANVPLLVGAAAAPVDPFMAEDEGLNYAPDRLLVKFAATPAGEAAAAAGKPLTGLRLLGDVGAAGGRTLGRPGRLLLFQITDGSSVEDKLEQLEGNPAVALAEPDVALQVARGTDDRLYSPRARSSGQWWLHQIGAPAAWDLTTGSAEVNVCVVDTGARSTHMDLAGNLAGGWSTGFDAEGARPSPDSPEFEDFEDADTLRGEYHGTHVAGIMGAVGGNRVGVAGVAHDMSLWACNAFTPSAEAFFMSSLIDCMALCNNVGSRVVSMSLGGYGHSRLGAEAIEALGRNGTLVVAAAGNDGADVATDAYFPASLKLDNVISVAASTAADELAYFSNWGAHIAAPGVGILSAHGKSDAAYITYAGTSMAAPLVTGAVALLYSAKPEASMAEIRNAILSSADVGPGLQGLVATGGRLNVARALAALLGTEEPAQPAQPSYSLVVERGVRYPISFGGGRFELHNATAAECTFGCESASWCYFAVHYGAETRTLRGYDDRPATGNCFLIDRVGVVTGDAIPGAFSFAYKSAVAPVDGTVAPHLASFFANGSADGVLARLAGTCSETSCMLPQQSNDTAAEHRAAPPPPRPIMAVHSARA